MKRFFCFAFVVLLTNVLVLANAEQWRLASPDGSLVANVTVENGTVHYALQHGYGALQSTYVTKLWYRICDFIIFADKNFILNKNQQI